MADSNWSATISGELQRQAAEFTPNKDKAAIGENILGLRLPCLYGSSGRGGVYGARARSRSIRQRHLRAVPQNAGSLGTAC